MEALEAADAEGLEVVRVVVLVDRSGGEAGRRAAERGVPYTALFLPEDLGVGGAADTEAGVSEERRPHV